MKTIQELADDLNQALSSSFSLFDKRQGLRFDWLRTIELEIDQIEETKNAQETEEESQKPIRHIRESIANSPEKYKIEKSEQIEEKEEEIEFNNDDIPVPKLSSIAASTSALSTPIPKSPGFKFVDDDCLLESSSSDDDNDDSVEIDEDEKGELCSRSPFNLSNSLKELTSTANSFKEQWMEMLNEKKQEELETPKKPVKFAFEEDEPMTNCYKISDDDEEAEFDDEDEIYERNPIEIHGKLIPNWARGEMLEKGLQRQSKIDPNTVFTGFPTEISLEEVFGIKNPKWNVRQESDIWEESRISLCETKKPLIIGK